MKSILDRTFRYVPASQSTPERLLRIFRERMRERQANDAEAKAKVKPIQRRKSA